MTATLYTPGHQGRKKPQSTKRHQLARNGWSGWPGWIVPAKPLAEFILDKYHLLDAPEDNQGDGWRAYLSQEIAHFTKTLSEESASRRLYGVLSGEQQIINVSFAEAACMAFGLDLDYDTKIPTLPGNISTAEELIRVRSGIKDDLEVRRQARTVIRLSAMILAYPHNQERLQDLAPHNCLRPYR